MNDILEKSVVKNKTAIGLQPILQAIMASKRILSLTENWDEAGALPISPQVHETATRFLKNYATFIFKKYKTVIEAPSINPVNNGSIDLEWHTPTVRLLINIRDTQSAHFYGDHHRNINPIKGSISAQTVEPFFAAWLLKLRP
jgi:hypothetical protein